MLGDAPPSHRTETHRTMSTIDNVLTGYAFNRQRTLNLLDGVAQKADPAAVLAWRPGPGRAHIAWQLMHVAVTEEVFASERLAPDKPGQWRDLWPRYQGGSTPADEAPPLGEIRQLLAATREHLVDTLRRYDDRRLDEIPAPMAQRKLTVRDVLNLLSWHEAHHQGQAHLTLNLYQAQHPG